MKRINKKGDHLLLEFYAKCKYPNAIEINWLAKETKMDADRIISWFGRKRYLDKKKMQQRYVEQQGQSGSYRSLEEILENYDDEPPSSSNGSYPFACPPEVLTAVQAMEIKATNEEKLDKDDPMTDVVAQEANGTKIPYFNSAFGFYNVCDIKVEVNEVPSSLDVCNAIWATNQSSEQESENVFQNIKLKYRK